MGHTSTATLLLGWTVITLTRAEFVNVAQGKSYRQSTVARSQTNPNASANGDTSGEYPGNCMRSKTNDDDRPWYEVDLGRVYPVYNIDIWSRTSYQPKLYPSTIKVDGEACTTVAGPWDGRQKSVTCSEVMYGRRVRVTLDRRTWMCMCEIQIWVCVDGWYGDQCSVACPNGCRNTGCDRNSGQCASCDTGYRGDNCEAGHRGQDVQSLTHKQEDGAAAKMPPHPESARRPRLRRAIPRRRNRID